MEKTKRHYTMSLCVRHESQTARQTDRQTDRQTEGTTHTPSTLIESRKKLLTLGGVVSISETVQTGPELQEFLLKVIADLTHPSVFFF